MIAKLRRRWGASAEREPGVFEWTEITREQIDPLPKPRVNMKWMHNHHFRARLHRHAPAQK